MASFVPYRTTELVPGTLYAVGGLVDTSVKVSWIGRHMTGFMPVSCYLLKNEGHALLVDCGLPVHYPSVAKDLAALVADCHRVDMIMTRREPDNIINLPGLIGALGIRSIYCAGIIDPLDFFDLFEETNTNAHFLADTSRMPKWVVPGATIKVGSLEVSVSRSELRVLSVFYFHEATTGTLFGADSWSMLTQEHAATIEVVREIDERMRAPSIEKSLEGRFEWLLGARLTTVKDCIASLERFQPIERICGTYGCIIEGRETVRTVLAETVLALAAMERRRPADHLKGFTEDVFRRALRDPATV